MTLERPPLAPWPHPKGCKKVASAPGDQVHLCYTRCACYMYVWFSSFFGSAALVSRIYDMLTSINLSQTLHGGANMADIAAFTTQHHHKPISIHQSCRTIFCSRMERWLPTSRPHKKQPRDANATCKPHDPLVTSWELGCQSQTLHVWDTQCLHGVSGNGSSVGRKGFTCLTTSWNVFHVFHVFNIQIPSQLPNVFHFGPKVELFDRCLKLTLSGPMLQLYRSKRL